MKKQLVVGLLMLCFLSMLVIGGCPPPAKEVDGNAVAINKAAKQSIIWGMKGKKEECKFFKKEIEEKVLIWLEGADPTFDKEFADGMIKLVESLAKKYGVWQKASPEVIAAVKDAVEILLLYYKPPSLKSVIQEYEMKYLLAFFKGIVEGCDFVLKQ